MNSSLKIVQKAHYIRFGFLMAACLFCHIAAAQPEIENSKLLSFAQGLSDRSVQSIAQDSRGFLWIATAYGLNRYDGYQFQVFDNNSGNPFKITESRLKEVKEIKGGKIALLNSRTPSLIELVDIHSFKNEAIYLNTGSGVSGKIKAVFLEEKGDVYALSADLAGFHLFKLSTPRKFIKLGSVAFPEFRLPEEVKFIRGRSGNFWLLDARNGLVEFNSAGNLLRRITMAQMDQFASVSDVPYFTSVLHEDRSGKLWVSCPQRKGIFTLESGSNLPVRPPGLPGDEVYSGIWEDRKGQLMVGTFKSFGRIKHLFMLDQHRKVVDYQPVLDIDDKINVVFGDDFKQQLFTGTFVGFNTINFSKRPLRWVLAEKQLENNDWDSGISIRSVTGDGQGNIYISRELKAWYHLKMPSLEIETIIPEDDAGNPLRLYCCSNVVYDNAGYLWGGSCATDMSGLLYRYNLSTGQTKVFRIAQMPIRHIIQSESGGLWILSGMEDKDGLLLYFDTETERAIPYLNKNGTNPLNDLFPAYGLKSRSGKIWIGTDAGLICIDLAEKTSRIINQGDNSLSNDNILVIHEAEDGNLWLGTYGGLNIFNPETSEVRWFSMAEGLCNNTVCGILPDGQGNYWLSTFAGLSLFNVKDQLFSNFYKDKGLTFNEFNRHAFYKDNEENFYFGTLNGLNVFKNSDFEKRALAKFPLQLTRIVKVSNSGSVETLEENLATVKEVELSPGYVALRLEFMLPDFTHPERNRFAIWLEGVDKNWRYLGSKNFIEIMHLPAGQYKLRVKAGEANGLWQDDEISLTLTVKKHFYQTTWFLASFPVVILLLSYFLSRLIINRIRNREEEKTAMNQKFAELELHALQSQMNPHFVFNSLGAIQFFIQNNNIEAADDYLAKFAKLMRFFLESSKNKYISLAREVELLSLYIELERMRFDNKFQAEIDVDPALDIYSCEIPSVLIQPFVENAINHGLFHKQTPGHLRVSFLDNKDGAVTCIIEDDGIGRRKSYILKEKTSRQHHHSRGTQLVKERLEVIKQVDKLNIQLQIIDLEEEGIGKTGTKIIIIVPQAG